MKVRCEGSVLEFSEVREMRFYKDVLPRDWIMIQCVVKGYVLRSEETCLLR